MRPGPAPRASRTPISRWRVLALASTRLAVFPQTASSGFPAYYGLDPNARTPYVQQWQAGIQQELRGRILLEVAYVGTKGTRLGRYRQNNTALHTVDGENLPPRPGDLQALREFPTLGPIVQREDLANSIYHSLQIKAEKRLSSRLTILSSFVWSKCSSTFPAASAPTTSAGRNGRMPTAAAMPMPWKMSKARCTQGSVRGGRSAAR